MFRVKGEVKLGRLFKQCKLETCRIKFRAQLLVSDNARRHEMAIGVLFKISTGGSIFGENDSKWIEIGTVKTERG